MRFLYGRSSLTCLKESSFNAAIRKQLIAIIPSFALIDQMEDTMPYISAFDSWQRLSRYLFFKNKWPANKSKKYRRVSSN